MTRDEALHCAGAAAIMAVCIGADIAAHGVVWAGAAFNALFWPGREWLQHRGRDNPWSEDKMAEAWLPVIVAMLIASIYSAVRAFL